MATGGTHKVYWASDNRHLALMDGDRTIVLWDTETDRRITISPPTQTSSVVWSPDHSRVALTGADGAVRVYDSLSGAMSGSYVAGGGTQYQPDLDGPTHREITVPEDRVRDVIGAKGAVIRSIETETGTTIGVGDHGDMTIDGSSAAAVDAAERMIRQIVEPPKVAIGERFRGRVASLTAYGAFVSLVPGRDGLLHVNKLGGNTKVTDIASVLKMGDEIEVVIENILDNGKISLDLAP